jgi:glucuronokinase
VQSYGGLTYMDFSDGGTFSRLDSRWLPRFGLAYLAEDHFGTIESGRVHSDVRHRWEQGDPDVRRTMKAIARCAESGREALKQRDWRALARLMDRNFDLRRAIFGDEVLGRDNLALVETARELGLAAKLPGSSGAALVLLDDANKTVPLAEAYASKGYRFQPIQGF